MNRKVTESCKAIRKIASTGVKGHMFGIIVFGLLCQILIQGPALIVDFLPAKFQSNFIVTIINCYAVFVNGPVSLSLCHYFSKVFRGEQTNGPSEISYGFANVPRVLILYIRIRIITWLWSLLFVIPGIIASISYSQSFFILNDHPEKTVTECMRESAFMMFGNKKKYLALILSYAPIYILCMIPAFYCYITVNAPDIAATREFMIKYDLENALLSATTISPYVNLLLLLTAIAMAIAGPARAAFYDILCGKLIINYGNDFSHVDTANAEVMQDIKEHQETQRTVIDADYKIVEDEDDAKNND